MNRKVLLFILIFSTFIWSSIFGFMVRYLTYTSKSNTIIVEKIVDESDIPIETINAQFRNFYYDRIIIVARDDQDKIFYLLMHLPRKQSGIDSYRHYYTVTYSYGDNEKTNWIDEMHKSSTVVTTDFMPYFENNDNGDLSTKESFKIELNIEGDKIQINADNFNGDFISKNRPANTRFVSTGNATIEVNGNKFSGNIMSDTVYSDDYAVELHFENKEELIAKSQSIVMWDEDDNFYLIDITDVENIDLPYKTHRWILYKNKQENYTKKAFDAEFSIDFKDDDIPGSWTIAVPELDNIEFNLDFVKYTDPFEDKGIVQGKVFVENEFKNLLGHFVYYNYEGNGN